MSDNIPMATSDRNTRQSWEGKVAMGLHRSWGATFWLSSRKSSKLSVHFEPSSISTKTNVGTVSVSIKVMDQQKVCGVRFSPESFVAQQKQRDLSTCEIGVDTNHQSIMGLQREWGAPTVEAQATLTSTGHPCMWPIGSRALMIVTGFNNHLYSTMKCQGHASVQQDKSNANGARFKVAFLFDTVCEAQQCFRWLQGLKKKDINDERRRRLDPDKTIHTPTCVDLNIPLAKRTVTITEGTGGPTPNDTPLFQVDSAGKDEGNSFHSMSMPSSPSNPVVILSDPMAVDGHGDCANNSISQDCGQISAMIKRYLLDPEFAARIHQIEDVWQQQSDKLSSEIESSTIDAACQMEGLLASHALFSKKSHGEFSVQENQANSLHVAETQSAGVILSHVNVNSDHPFGYKVPMPVGEKEEGGNSSSSTHHEDFTSNLKQRIAQYILEPGFSAYKDAVHCAWEKMEQKLDVEMCAIERGFHCMSTPQPTSQ